MSRKIEELICRQKLFLEAKVIDRETDSLPQGATGKGPKAGFQGSFLVSGSKVPCPSPGKGVAGVPGEPRAGPWPELPVHAASTLVKGH